MLTNTAIFKELENVDMIIEKTDLERKQPVEFAKIKILSLILKLLSSMRTNQTLVMDKMGVKKIEPLRKEETKKE
jgi:hypothetical protein